ncbi:hypothetical protein [Burkholderia metallica]|uniref:hypothetical protein n=1 Tax=Burkholderia metallica TaxID=488729 RepID=UPI0020C63365|nr:hypothetical protein [Burkholderia metallica]
MSAVPRGRAISVDDVHGHARGACCTRVMCHVFGRVVGENACARIDPARQSSRCAARIAIQSQSRRGAMTSVNACARTRCTASMTANADANADANANADADADASARNRSLRHRAGEYRRAVESHAPIHRHRSMMVSIPKRTIDSNAAPAIPARPSTR